MPRKKGKAPSEETVAHIQRLTGKSKTRILLHTAPRTDTQLWHFIRATTGFEIPRRAVCRNHCAPFDPIADAYFHRNLKILVLASRLSGKTAGFACLHWTEVVHKTIGIVHFGAIAPQANKGYEYFRDFVYDNPEILARVDGEPKIGETRIRGPKPGQWSRIHQHPLTRKQASSPHENVLSLDEVDEIERWENYQQALFIPETKNGIPAQTRIGSTRHRGGGPMSRIVETYKKAGRRIYEYCIWEVLKPCEPERSCRGCPAWKFCEGVAKDLPPGGWSAVQDFINKCEDSDSKSIWVQLFNKEPMSEELVYGEWWDDSRNIVPNHEIPEDALRYRGMDFGHTVVGWAYYDGHNLVFYDYQDFARLPSMFLGERILEREQGDLKRKREDAQYPWHILWPEGKSRKKPVPASIVDSYVDHAPDARNNLLEAGIDTTNAIKDYEGGIQTCRAWLEKGRLKFMQRTVEQGLVPAIKAHRWQKGADGKPKEFIPLKDGTDHPCDMTRYLTHTIKVIGTGGAETMTIEGI